MVLVYKSEHEFKFNFSTASLAYFNKYPNPFSSHVISADTIRQWVDENGRLHSERLILKRGRLPGFIKPFLKGISDSWILETSIVDPKSATLKSCTRNLDHTRLLKVEEFTVYKADSLNSSITKMNNRMSFVSNFGGWGLKDRIESWSYKECKDRIIYSKKGMSFVMEQLRAKGIKTYSQMQIMGLVETVDVW